MKQPKQKSDSKQKTMATAVISPEPVIANGVSREAVIKAAVEIEKTRFSKKCKDLEASIQQQIQRLITPYLHDYATASNIQFIDAKLDSKGVPEDAVAKASIGYSVSNLGVTLDDIGFGYPGAKSRRLSYRAFFVFKAHDQEFSFESRWINLSLSKIDKKAVLLLLKEKSEISASMLLLDQPFQYWEDRVLEKLGLGIPVSVQVSRLLKDPGFVKAVTDSLSK